MMNCGNLFRDFVSPWPLGYSGANTLQLELRRDWQWELIFPVNNRARIAHQLINRFTGVWKINYRARDFDGDTCNKTAYRATWLISLLSIIPGTPIWKKDTWKEECATDCRTHEGAKLSNANARRKTCTCTVILTINWMCCETFRYIWSFRHSTLISLPQSGHKGESESLYGVSVQLKTRWISTKRN